MRVLVTGGAGFLGSHLVDALVARGDDVRVLDNLRRGSLQHIESHVDAGKLTFIRGDVRDESEVWRAARDAEVVYHLAAQSNVMGALEDVDYSFGTNVIGTFNTLKAAAAAGSRRLVFASSREVYGDSESLPVPESAALLAKNPYGASKVAGEAYCRVWQQVKGLDCLALRFANLYGPRDRDRVIPLWLSQARRGEDLVLFGGQQVLDFFWVGHAVRALIAAADSPNEGPINVGSGQGVALPNLAERVVKLTGSRSAVRRCPAREVEVVRFVADVGKMRRLLGVDPPPDPLDSLPSLASAEAARDRSARPEGGAVQV